MKLHEAFDDVLDGEMDPKRATALAALAGAIVRATSVGELDARLDAIERVLKGRTE